MSNITELELQNLKHLIGGHQTMSAKLSEYADRATDPEVKNYFTKGANSAAQTKKTLMNFLN